MAYTYGMHGNVCTINPCACIVTRMLKLCFTLLDAFHGCSPYFSYAKGSLTGKCGMHHAYPANLKMGAINSNFLVGAVASQ